MLGMVLADVEQVGVQAAAQGRDQQRGADEAAHPRDDGAGGHHRAGAEDAASRGARCARRVTVGRPPGRGRPSGDEASRCSRARRRIRRTSRTAIAPNSRATPVPRITQITSLTWAERIGSVSSEPSGVPVLVGRRAARTLCTPSRSVVASSRTEVRPLWAGSSTRLGPGDLQRGVGDGLDPHRHRVVELVGHGGGEVAGGAGQRDRRGALDGRPRQLLGDHGWSGRRRPGRRRGGRGRRRTARSAASSRTWAPTVSLRSSTVLRAIWPPAQSRGGGEVGGVELALDLLRRVVEVAPVDVGPGPAALVAPATVVSRSQSTSRPGKNPVPPSGCHDRRQQPTSGRRSARASSQGGLAEHAAGAAATGRAGRRGRDRRRGC